jgi:hypothetical protein
VNSPSGLSRSRSTAAASCRLDAFCEDLVHSTVRVEPNGCISMGLIIGSECPYLDRHRALYHSVRNFRQAAQDPQRPDAV